MSSLLVQESGKHDILTEIEIRFSAFNDLIKNYFFERMIIVKEYSRLVEMLNYSKIIHFLFLISRFSRLVWNQQCVFHIVEGGRTDDGVTKRDSSLKSNIRQVFFLFFSAAIFFIFQRDWKSSFLWPYIILANIPLGIQYYHPGLKVLERGLLVETLPCLLRKAVSIVDCSSKLAC